MSILEISEEASLKVLAVRSEESDAEKLGLRVAVSGVSGVEYSYDLAFVPVEEVEDEDISYEVGELTVIIPSASKDKLAGATLDIPQNADQGGLVIRNPNRPNPLGDIGELELTGDVPDRINQLLEQKVNPALAKVKRSVSLVCPIVVPLIITLSTVKVVSVPKLVTLPCAAVAKVPVNVPVTVRLSAIVVSEVV